jgi:peptidoglycan-associated lipoprotein
MNKVIAKSGVVVAIGMALLASQGCNKQWLQSDSDGGSVSASSKLPSISRGGSNNELSGFSRNPSEERLAQGGYSTALNPSGLSALQR